MLFHLPGRPGMCVERHKWAAGHHRHDLQTFIQFKQRGLNTCSYTKSHSMNACDHGTAGAAQAHANTRQAGARKRSQHTPAQSSLGARKRMPTHNESCEPRHSKHVGTRPLTTLTIDTTQEGAGSWQISSRAHLFSPWGIVLEGSLHLHKEA